MTEERNDPAPDYDPERPPSPEDQATLREILAGTHGMDEGEIDKAEAEEAKDNEPAMKMKPEFDYTKTSQEGLDVAAAFELAQNFDVKVTEADRDAYLRAVLTDAPFEHTIKLYGDKFKVRLRGRTLEEQEAVSRLLQIGVLVGDIPEDNGIVQMTFVQYFVLMFSLLGVNEEQYSPPEVGMSEFTGANVPRSAYTPELYNFSDATWAKLVESDPAKYQQLRKAYDAERKALLETLQEDPLYREAMVFVKALRKMHQTKLHMVVDAARMFEMLCAKLGTEATAPNFSKPQDEQP